MAVQVSYPGVYIEEFTPAAPIQAVGMGVAAFIGVVSRGPLRKPTKITSWDRFRALFGDEPAPGFFLWYAVRGFKENGGEVCYVVRASNGKYDRLTIKTSVGTPAQELFEIVAREPGATGISAATQRQHLLEKTNTSLFLPTGSLTIAANPGDKQIILSAAEAATFRPGDIVTIAALGESAMITRVVSGPGNSTLLLNKPLANGYAGGATVRLADAPAGTRVVRIESAVPLPPNALVEGAMLTFEQGPANSATQIVEGVQVEHLSATKTTYRVTLRQGIGFPVDMSASTAVESQEFSLTITQGGSTVYEGLALDSLHPRYYLRAINDDPDALVTIEPREPPPTIVMPGNMPEDTAASLAGGAAEDLTTLADHDFTDALDTLRSIDDVSMVAVPDRITPAVQTAVIADCEELGRFAILDCRAGLDPFDPAGILGQRKEVDCGRGHAAVYYPWLRIPPARRGDPILAPSSGHIGGVISRVARLRGSHKAPANEILNGALGVERLLSDIDHGQLNIAGVNVIRVFQSGGRPVIFGARTTSIDRNWQYINVRMLFLEIEKSIQVGIRPSLFEPNTRPLWKKLIRSISDFLERMRRDGAIFGAKPEEAYYVRIDDALNPFSEQALGRLHIEIGVRPSYPAEFIVVRIGIWPGGTQIEEA